MNGKQNDQNNSCPQMNFAPIMPSQAQQLAQFENLGELVKNTIFVA